MSWCSTEKVCEVPEKCGRRALRWCARCTQSGLGRPVGTIVCLHSDRLSLAREVNLSRDFSWISNFQIDVLIAPSLVRAKLSQACWQLPKMNEGRDCITAARVWAVGASRLARCNLSKGIHHERRSSASRSESLIHSMMNGAFAVGIGKRREIGAKCTTFPAGNLVAR